MMNKKGSMFMPIIFIGVLFVVLLIGVLIAAGGAVINWAADEIVPEVSNLGVVAGTNLTDVAEDTIAPVNSVIQSFSWMGGIFYVMILVGSIIFAVAMRFSGSKWLLAFYLLLMLILIFGSIFVSNIYQDFHDGNDELATRLQEQTLLSFFILYSPVILTFIAFITGIIMFSGLQEEQLT